MRHGEKSTNQGGRKDVDQTLTVREIRRPPKVKQSSIEQSCFSVSTRQWSADAPADANNGQLMPSHDSICQWTRRRTAWAHKHGAPRDGKEEREGHDGRRCDDTTTHGSFMGSSTHHGPMSHGPRPVDDGWSGGCLSAFNGSRF